MEFSLSHSENCWTVQNKVVSEYISLCRQMYCMSKFQVILLHVQCENSKVPWYYLEVILLSEIWSCLMENCNILPPNFFQPMMLLPAIKLTSEAHLDSWYLLHVNGKPARHLTYTYLKAYFSNTKTSCAEVYIGWSSCKLMDTCLCL